MERHVLSPDCRNRILEILPERDVMHMAPLMTPCHVMPRQVLLQRGEPIRDIYLPYDAVLATVVACRNGQTPQTSVIGNEGFAPLHALFGATHALDTIVCAVEGTCARIRLQDFQLETQHNPRLRLLLEQCAQAYLLLLAQHVGCNRLHSLRQRYPRALLSILDRINHQAFTMNQDFLAELLGVHRPSLSGIAHEFQQDGAIVYSRGRVSVIDRRKLELSACECYINTRGHFERLLGLRIG